MSDISARYPRLDQFYQDYLNNENSSSFIRDVSQKYSIATLCRLSEYGGRITRRAAVLALGLIGDYGVNATLGRGMLDSDRAVRLLAENAIKEIWFRAGSEQERLELQAISRTNCSEHYYDSIDRATKLIERSPWIAEAWNQRAIAFFSINRYKDSANDCHQTLEINPYHFGAAVGMGHCYLELNDAQAALDCFKRALRVNPNLDGVRAQVEFLERSI